MKYSAAKMGVLVAVGLTLSGCVAAVIPIAAGGAIVGKDRIDSLSNKRVAAETDAPAVADGAETPSTARAETKQPVLTRDSATLTQPGPAFVDIADMERRPNEPAPELEPKVEAENVVSVPSAPSGLSPRAYDALYRYAQSEAARDPADRPRRAAFLAAPGSLSPARADCSIRPPAVLIDLDPSGGLFDPDSMRQVQPTLPGIVHGLRAQEVDIFWLSGQTALKAADIRRSLVASGLDPDGDDGLLLMRRAQDRKQERRKDVQATHCLIAIAGDTRSDFDELYDFLKRPELAQPLEELVGAGWFLAPPPLSSGQSLFTVPQTSSEGQ